MNFWCSLVALIVVALASGCASKRIQDDVPQVMTNAPPGNVQLAQVINDGWQEHAGTPVRWGGTVVDVARHSNRTELEILERKVDRGGRPYYSGSSAGRFAVVPYPSRDLEVGDEITILGRVSGVTERRIGKERRLLPLVSLDAHHRWPPHRPRRAPHRHRHHHHASDYVWPFVAAALIIGLGSHFGVHYHSGGYHYRFGGHRH